MKKQAADFYQDLRNFHQQLHFLSLLLLSSCGFRVIDNKKLNNFKIANLEITGDNKIAYHIKNNLLNKGNNDKQKINLKINIQREKKVKEKNINNEVTKYEIIIKLDVTYIINLNGKKGQFKINQSGNYQVESQYSQTLNNEKKLQDTLNTKLSNELRENLSSLINDS